jgi:hypothetical protein
MEAALIKASAVQKNHRQLFLLGLSDMNLQKLREGLPIRLSLESIGGVGDIVIVWGETEEAILTDLAPLFGPDTTYSREI